MNTTKDSQPLALGSTEGLGPTPPLVERLREMSRRGYWPILGEEAADEIERLRAALADSCEEHRAEVYDTATGGGCMLLHDAVAAERERWTTAARLVVDATPDQLPLALDALAVVLRA